MITLILSACPAPKQFQSAVHHVEGWFGVQISLSLFHLQRSASSPLVNDNSKKDRQQEEEDEKIVDDGTRFPGVPLALRVRKFLIVYLPFFSYRSTVSSSNTL